MSGRHGDEDDIGAGSHPPPPPPQPPEKTLEQIEARNKEYVTAQGVLLVQGDVSAFFEEFSAKLPPHLICRFKTGMDGIYEGLVNIRQHLGFDHREGSIPAPTATDLFEEIKAAAAAKAVAEVEAKAAAAIAARDETMQ
jgi:hypothetical protein